jgi:hypothetical protein
MEVLESFVVQNATRDSERSCEDRIIEGTESTFDAESRIFTNNKKKKST